jgi:Ser/Thr protein kinase RdoA (MazF antagonist)
MDVDYILESPLEWIKPRVNHLPLVTASLDALAGRIAARMTCAKKQLRDWGFCHGDIHADNARINGSDLVLFDFDSCGSGWRLFDLASYRWDARRQGVERLAWEPFIEGYLQVRPRTAESLEFVGLFMILRHLWVTAQWIGLADELGVGFLSEDFLEDLVPFCEKIETDTAAGR